MSTMRQIWFNNQPDVELRNENSPIDWLQLADEKVLDSNYIIRSAQNTNEDLEGAAEVLRNSFSVIKNTEFDILLEANGFSLVLGQGDNFNKGEFHLILAEESATKIVSALALLKMAKKQRNCELVALATHTEHQRKGIGKEIGRIFDQYMANCGVEMAFVWAAAEHTATQKILKDRDFVPRAVIPGYYRIWAGENQYRRTIEVFMQKFYNGAEKMATRNIDLLPEIDKLIVPWRE